MERPLEPKDVRLRCASRGRRGWGGRARGPAVLAAAGPGLLWGARGRRQGRGRGRLGSGAGTLVFGPHPDLLWGLRGGRRYKAGNVLVSGGGKYKSLFSGA